MKKVFGYPEFDKIGEKILTTYENEYADMRMDIRVYRMKSKAHHSLKEWNEAVSYLLGCEVHFKDYGEIEKSLKPFSLEVK